MGQISTTNRRTLWTTAAAIALGILLFCGGSVHSQIRIMPLGDSITEGVLGSSDDTGYRRALYLSLTDAGISVNFVGSLANGSPTDFDPDHEGHNGWRADEILNGRHGAGNITSWLTKNPPDIILLHIGTNDISQDQSVGSTVSEVNQILDRIDAKSTATVVFLARIINRNDTVVSRITATTHYNDSLQQLANTRIAAGDLIFVVDQESALSYPADIADRVHPNDGGYAKMAQRWFEALSAYLTPVAVQLSSFTGRAVGKDEVRLEWTTLTETDCYGFEVCRMRGETGAWTSIGVVEGHGTTVAPHFYSHVDHGVTFGKYSYQIKQIDLDGKSKTFPEVEVMVGVTPDRLVLAQNYPNPFNPSTVIEFVMPQSSFASVKVYNLLGQQVATLFEGNAEPSTIHTVRFDGTRMASGLYFYRLQSLGKAETKPMILVK
jgi:lysophospholipase L1-like esterase